MSEFNLLAVAVGAVAGFVLGIVLYHPRVLGTVWMRGAGVDPDGRPPVLAFVFMIAGLILLAIVVGMTATVNFLGTAILAILAAAGLALANAAFAGRSGAALGVDALFIIGAGALMILAQGIF